MATSALSRRYADALISIAKDNKSVDAVGADLATDCIRNRCDGRITRDQCAKRIKLAAAHSPWKLRTVPARELLARLLCRHSRPCADGVCAGTAGPGSTAGRRRRTSTLDRGPL